MRSVPRIESRLKEAINLGFKRCIVSEKNLKGVLEPLKKKIQLTSINRVEEAIQIILG